MFLEPLGDISVDHTIFGLGKQTPLTIQILALHIMAPIPFVDPIGVNERIEQNTDFATKTFCERVGFEQSFNETYQRQCTGGFRRMLPTQ